jgi:hypothetical protein
MGEILFCEFDLNDHGFASDGLIEIKTPPFCTMGKISRGRIQQQDGPIGR